MGAFTEIIPANGSLVGPTVACIIGEWQSIFYSYLITANTPPIIYTRIWTMCFIIICSMGNQMCAFYLYQIINHLQVVQQGSFKINSSANSDRTIYRQLITSNGRSLGNEILGTKNNQIPIKLNNHQMRCYYVCVSFVIFVQLTYKMVNYDDLWSITT